MALHLAFDSVAQAREDEARDRVAFAGPLPELKRALLMIEARNATARDGTLAQAAQLIRQSLFALQGAAP